MYPDPGKAVCFTWACALGSILPDIDSPSSMISKCIPILPTLVCKIFGHRGLFHAPIVPLLAYGMTKIFESMMSEITYVALSGIFIGYVLHLLQDSFTIGGVPIFYPFSSYKLNFSCARSGSFWNYPTTCFLVVLCIVCCIYGVKTPKILFQAIGNFLGTFQT